MFVDILQEKSRFMILFAVSNVFQCHEMKVWNLDIFVIANRLRHGIGIAPSRDFLMKIIVNI